MARPDLTGSEALEASSLLARPTDGADDPFANGYTVPSSSQCGDHVCVHYVPTTADAPPSLDWVALTLTTMENVYEREVNQLGFRPPRKDGNKGGDGKLDVYLKDLGTGLYGYCAAEFRKKARTASGFCVLDNDYAAAQFPDQTPENNLAVTAAHEFFHAVQYSYDYNEDPWMLESTATRMEEQVADSINDNRQYLQYSQLRSGLRLPRRVQLDLRLPVRQLDLLGIPHLALQHRTGEEGPGGRGQPATRRPALLHRGHPVGAAQEEVVPDRCVRRLRGRQRDAEPLLRRGARGAGVRRPEGQVGRDAVAGLEVGRRPRRARPPVRRRDPRAARR
ncbi:MXAN_6640 family putative metalloprotease [Nocardioides sp. B-3]|uniref:MXAN_6640 family putative metalloprotease n=1 Tax=Nocardioides sp. B-3 TaxID=2895565 RepID=UPI0021538212|nr:MXAN_6640 family putative metalloprotease [Nocardioides sp. B-3]UUZ58301.1 hypothetical protein LP418_19010 [Nocardioides sp. B-3]